MIQYLLTPYNDQTVGWAEGIDSPHHLQRIRSDLRLQNLENE